jgi:L-lactate dehydrogenase complex protein LldG
VSARDAILRAVRAARPPAVPLPDVRLARASFAAATDGALDLPTRFAHASRAGGAHVVDGTRDGLSRLVRESYPGAPRIASAVPDVAGTVPLPDTPHAGATLDVFVCEGVLGVAENGAVWLPGSRLGHRAALFLAANVVIVLDRDRIVPDLHEAYARLDVAAEPFGAFVAGPSKTADIEQSLVVGAHGPKTLAVMLVASG